MSMGTLWKMKIEEGIGIITFDIPGEPVNTWTEEAIKEFFELVDTLEKELNLRGVILISGKPNNFHSGANLRFLEQFQSKEESAKALDRFHQAFSRWGKLPYPTLAAIHGHCLGGGYELALACTARIAKESKTTLIGLPECTVGVFPGGGGTQRLPRLIGYPAVELILKGRILSASEADAMGMIDRLVPAEGDLIKEGKNFIKEISEGKANLKRPKHDFSQIDSVMEMARQEVLKATRGRELPAPMLAIKAIQEGLKVPLTEGLEIEKRYFVEVVLSNEAKGNIHTFFLKTETDKPISMVPKNFQPKPIRKVGVLGFGTMGRGIVIDLLRNMEIPVVVKDIPEALEPGKAFVRKILDGMAEKRTLKASVDDLMKRLTVTPSYDGHFKDVDIVIEAVFEDLRVKDQVYREVSPIVSSDCIIASNTSTIPVTRMSKSVTHPERFGGAHFFSPVWMMQLLEIIKGEKTSLDTIHHLLSFAGAIRKRPIVCNDNPGFVVNALLQPYCMKVYGLMEEGVAIERIDSAMVKFGMPVGPVKLIDEVGIDVQHLAFLAMGIEPPQTLKNVVQDGRAGLKKSGKGFFLKDGSVDPSVLPLIANLGRSKEMTVQDIQMLLYGEFVKKGKELLDQGIVDSPKTIDVGMIWGIGFPPDKGGPMKWADLTGLSLKLYEKKFY
jgi:3-hydroxyacyl-CoA dehydrogenase/enoyl-CoA hydratase/3-hydroxybutyryl-CoA epimerase